MREYLPIFILGALALIFAITYVLNKRTPIPEDCVHLIDEASCSACQNHACSHHIDTEEENHVSN